MNTGSFKVFMDKFMDRGQNGGHIWGSNIEVIYGGHIWGHLG